MVMHLDEEAVRAGLRWEPLIDEMEAALTSRHSTHEAIATARLVYEAST